MKPSEQNLDDLLDSIQQKATQPYLIPSEAIDAMNDEEITLYIVDLLKALPSRVNMRKPITLMRNRLKEIVADEKIPEVIKEELTLQLVKDFHHANHEYEASLQRWQHRYPRARLGESFFEDIQRNPSMK
ncbi:hypothetical protein L479_02753 [Exiguobacterium sp. S17]|nr:hypothetical protein L479_02753 [Exiguobacterium sp. S17]